MDQFLSSLPKTVLALGAITIGFFLIVMFNPPHSVCDSQLEIFREAQKIFIYKQGKDRPPLAKSQFDLCLADNSPGSCFEFFQGLKKLSIDLRNIPSSCSASAAGETEVNTWLWQSLKLMVQVAWGPKAPSSYSEKHSWFDASDIALFCGLKKDAVRIFGEEQFATWREDVMKSLPQAESMQRDQIWHKSILSTSCEAYR